MGKIPVSQNIAVGEWVCVSEDGIQAHAVKADGDYLWLYSWASKKELLKYMQGIKMDAAKVPNVKRIASGHYRYRPKDVDTLRYGDSYEIVKITAVNIEHYRELTRPREGDE